ncbi:MAG: sigma-70 family RNA polymerase sigma factor [Deltaproteobacteria bacterium]|nr:sigma-70 family RNA polymerase sigma factor [Deltaproteobacteria bacterium]
MSRKKHEDTDVATSEVDRTLVPSLGERRSMREGLVLLKGVAAKLHHQLGGLMSVDDLQSIGHVALVGLVRRYEAGPVPFPAYLRPRLRWAILDGIRRESHGRSAAARARALGGSERLAAQAVGEESSAALATEEGHQERLAVLLRDHAAVMGIALVASTEGMMARADSSTEPEKRTLSRALAQQLRGAVAALADERQRALIERHYFGDEPFDAIATTLGISKSWASRLHAQAIRALARQLVA